MEMESMKCRRVSLCVCAKTFSVVLMSTPDYFAADDAYCEVRLKASDSGWLRGVFFRYPKVKEETSWKQPVEWTDGLILYVPNLEEQTVLEAVRFLILNGYLAETFQECEAPDEVLPAFCAVQPEILTGISMKIEASIVRKLTQVFVQFKQLGCAHSRDDLRRKLIEYAERALETLDSG